MSPWNRTPGLVATLLLAGLAACAGERAADADPSAGATMVPTVEILSPVEGDTVSLPFTVRLRADGLTIVAATGIRQEGEGHHHLVIGPEFPAADLPIPGGPGYIHMGSGVSEWSIDSLPPGPHRIIAVLAWGDHVPVTSAEADTVNIVVR